MGRASVGGLGRPRKHWPQHLNPINPEVSGPVGPRPDGGGSSWWGGVATASTSWGRAWGASPDNNDYDDSDIKDGFWFYWFTIVMATYGIYCLWFAARSWLRRFRE